jgi:serine/threonine protein kinase
MSDSHRAGKAKGNARAETKVDVQSTTVPPESGAVFARDFAPGSLVGGKYVVEGPIGEGGLGVVVKAKHVQLEQVVAIKHLKPFATGRADVVERFLREARLAAKIKSEHAVRVQDVDAVDSGIPYMVMEFLDGRDLEQIVLESGPLPIQQAIDYVLQASEALAEAHAVGIVHRDLKPGNLFLARGPGGSSIVKVLDFGISKMTSKGVSFEKRVTRVDERIGTPVFMSPEQLQATPDVDARADIWALGVVLYELVTGKLPFDGEDLPQLCVAILTRPPVPLAAVHPDAPPELEAIIMRCLEKDRAKRYQNIAELAQDLAQMWEGQSPSRVLHISRVIREAGQKISPPTPFPGSIQVQGLAPTTAAPAQPAGPAEPARPVQPSISLEYGDPVVEDQVHAVFIDAGGSAIDEMVFLSIDEAYDYAASLGPEAVRCDLYDEFAGIRGRLRVTYVRRPETGHWVPLLK